MRKLAAAALVGFVVGAVTSGLLSGWLRVAPYLVRHERIDDVDVTVELFV